MFNFHAVNNRLFRGGSPSPADVKILRDKFGVNKIISLDEEVGKNIDRACKLLGIKHIILPIDIGKKSSLIHFLKQDITKLLDNKNGSTYIGCVFGKDRTGLATALYRCEHDGWSCDKALQEAYKYGFGIGVDPKIVSLYEKIIKIACGCEQDEHNIDDGSFAVNIVENQRSEPSDYHDYTLDALEQQSWSPYNDYRIRDFPYGNVNITNYTEQYSTREDYGLDSNEILFKHRKPVEMPQVGQFDENTQSLNGAGPSYVGSGSIT